MRIQTNSFVTRQVARSRFSHFNGTWLELKALVQAAVDAGKYEKGYRDGVWLVSVAPEGFYSPVCTLEEGDVLVGGFESRKKGEEPRQFVGVKGGRKTPAKHVEVVLYASEVLAEDDSNEFPVDRGNAEIISVNARSTDEPEPMHPNTLMANHFHASGGTNTMMGDALFMAKLSASFNYWKDKAMVVRGD